MIHTIYFCDFKAGDLVPLFCITFFSFAYYGLYLASEIFHKSSYFCKDLMTCLLLLYILKYEFP